eukprot:1070837-Karenia_brevis.AAC.1
MGQVLDLGCRRHQWGSKGAQSPQGSFVYEELCIKRQAPGWGDAPAGHVGALLLEASLLVASSRSSSS